MNCIKGLENKMHTAKDLRLAYSYCANHRKEMNKAGQCGCFYCGKIFSPQEISEWLETTEGDPDGTAICPYCESDTVMPENDRFPLTEAFLDEMHRFWFKTDFSNTYPTI